MNLVVALLWQVNHFLENLKNYTHSNHEGHKDHKCEFCGKSFSQADKIFDNPALIINKTYVFLPIVLADLYRNASN